MTPPKESCVVTNPVKPRARIYFAALLLLINLAGGLANIPVQFHLKDHLKLTPQQVAVFLFVSSIPLYAGFLVGFLRDRWRLSGWEDQGYFLLFSPIVAGSYLYLANTSVTYGTLLFGVLIAAIASQVLGAASQALLTVVAQRELMTGRLSALSEFVGAISVVLATLAGGWFAGRVSMNVVFLIAALLMLSVTCLSFGPPPGAAEARLRSRQATERSWLAIRRLIAHRALWTALAILLCWAFAPGWRTPLFYHLTETIRMSSGAYGIFNAVLTASSAAAIAIYGILCQRIPLTRLLWFGTVLGIVAGPLYLIIGTEGQAIAVAAIVGLLLGIGTAAYSDLLFRLYPAGLEGTGTMLATAGVAMVSAASDLLGSWLYQHGGFALALAITTATTTLIVPLLFLLPHGVVSTRDGERPIPRPAS